MRIMKKFINSRPLQPDCVQHAGVNFRHPRRWIAMTLKGGDAFDDNGAKFGNVIILVILHAVSEGAGGGHNGIF